MTIAELADELAALLAELPRQTIRTNESDLLAAGWFDRRDELLGRYRELELERARDDDELARLSVCVLNGWTDPAFARGKLQEEAVAIARAVIIARALGEPLASRKAPR